MPKDGKTLIMKFGGAAVSEPKSFLQLAELIKKRSESFDKVAIVISAMKGMTDQLISMAKEVNHEPSRREYDMLVSTGERISISLLAMALASVGHQAVSFTGSQSGIITTCEHSEARIVDVRPYRLMKQLDEKKTVIIAGFQGVSEEKEITTLGRGGSDTTAVALGVALRAEKVEFYKDVEGIFLDDPKKNKTAPFYRHLSYGEALKIVIESGGKVLHPRAIELAKKNGLPLHIRSFLDLEGEGTWILNSESDLPKREPVYEK